MTEQGHNDEASQVFFQSPERTFVAPELVRTSLSRVEHQGSDRARAAPPSSRGSSSIRWGTTSIARPSRTTCINRGKPPPLTFLPLHIRAFIQSEIDHALREFNAKVGFLHDQVKAVDAELSRINDERTRFREANADKLPEDSQMTHTAASSSTAGAPTSRRRCAGCRRTLEAARQQVAADRPPRRRSSSPRRATASRSPR